MSGDDFYATIVGVIDYRFSVKLKRQTKRENEVLGKNGESERVTICFSCT